MPRKTKRNNKPRTRSQTAKKRNNNRKRRTRRVYRKRVKFSQCRKKGPAACRGKKSCKYASGRKRSFCRRSKNRKVSVLPKSK